MHAVQKVQALTDLRSVSNEGHLNGRTM